MYLADPISHTATAAGLFAQLAGVLAAVAFVAVWFHLTRPAPDRGAAFTLLSAFVAFAVAAVLYAVLGGGPDTSAAAYLALLIDGTLLLFGLLALLHSLVWRFLPVVAGPVVGLLLIGTLFHRPDDGYSWSSPFGLAVGLALSLLLISLILYWWMPAGTGWAAGPAVVVSVVALLASVSGVLLLAQPASFEPSDGLTSTVLVTAFSALACFALLSAVAPAHTQEGSGGTSMAKENGLPVAGSTPTSVAYTQPPSSYGTPRDRAEITPALGVTLAVVVAVVAATGRWTLLDTALGLFSLGLLMASVTIHRVAVLRTPTLWVLAGAGGFSLTVVAGFFLQLWAPQIELPDQIDPLADVLLPATWVVATLLLALVLNLIRRSRQVKRSTPPKALPRPNKARPSVGELSDNTVVLSDGPTIAINVPKSPKE